MKCLTENSCINSTLICRRSISSNCFIQCNGAYSCKSTIIHCSQNTICNITGNGIYSLLNSKIYGSQNNLTIISCNKPYSCKHSIINAKYSSNLNVKCNANRKYENGCQHITIYCPYYLDNNDDIDAPKTCNIGRM